MSNKIAVLSLIMVGVLSLGCNGNQQASNDVNNLTSQSLKQAKSRLDPAFKSQIKMPEKLPFRVQKVTAHTIPISVKVQAFSKKYWNPNHGYLEVRVTGGNVAVGSDNNRPGVVKKDMTLGNGAKAVFMDTGTLQEIYWHDPDTGYLYFIGGQKNPDDKSQKYTVHQLKQVAESMSFLKEENQTRKPDFQGEILEIKPSSIVVGTDNVDPEASYPSFEVFINDKTKISGSVQSFSMLKVHQKVKIWVTGEWAHNQKKVARKIIVSQK